MVSSWGGYVFIINIIPIYVVLMIVIRMALHLLITRSLFTSSLHRLYHFLHSWFHSGYAGAFCRIQCCEAG